MATTTTNFGWTVPSDTDLVKDGAAAIRTALGGVDTSFVDLKGGTTGQVLAKASGTDLDFTWTADASGIPATILDAKGDLIAATAADTAARLAVGTNGQVLIADSTTATGLKWGTAGGGGKILQVVMGSTTSQTTSSTSTWIDTTLTASITPSASTSKVLVLVAQNGCNKSANTDTSMGLKLMRSTPSGFTELAQFAIYSLYTNSSAYNDGHHQGISYLDSPATTSSLTYKTQFNMDGSGGNVSVQTNSPTSTIILLEVGA